MKSIVVLLLALALVGAQAHRFGNVQECNEKKVLPTINAPCQKLEIVVPESSFDIHKKLVQPLKIPVDLHAHVPIDSKILLEYDIPIEYDVKSKVHVDANLLGATSFNTPVTKKTDDQIMLRNHVAQAAPLYSASIQCMHTCSASHDVCRDRCHPNNLRK